MYSLDAATPHDVAQLVPHLREADKEDMLVGQEQEPAEILSHLLKVSERSWCLKHEGKVVGMLGIVFDKTDDRMARPWAVFSDIASYHVAAICRNTERLIRRFMKQRPIFTTLVDKRNHLALQWIQWLGFEAIGSHKLGTNERDYYLFAKWDKEICHLQQ